jgi:hypothetical protein
MPMNEDEADLGHFRLTDKGRAFGGWRGFVACCFSIVGDSTGMAVFNFLYKYTWPRAQE